MSQDLIALGRDLMSMGQKILDANPSGEKSTEEKKPEVGGKVIDLPKKALIVASLKRKLGE